MMRSGCVALLIAAAPELGEASFLVKRTTNKKDPTWDTKAIQDKSTYESDFVKDDRQIDPNMVTVVHTQGSVNSASGGDGTSHEKGTAAWFKDQCQQINDHCKVMRDHRLALKKADLSHFESDYLRQKKILDDMKANHDDQKADVSAQKKQVADAKMEVKEAEAVVKENKPCRPELEAARAKLSNLKAIPNRVKADIDAECKAENLVLEKEKCVEKLVRAENVLAGREADHSGEKEDLHDEKKDVPLAVEPIPGQEKRVADALAAWEKEKSKPLEGSVAGIDSNCQAERDKLMGLVGVDVDGLWQEYLRQKSILEGKEHTHNQEKADVVEQKTDVADAKEEVESAKVVVAEMAHCPPELQAAKADLAKLKAEPNNVPAHIDAECKAENLVLEKQKCVDVLRRAQAVLAGHTHDYRGEKLELSNEKADAAVAKADVPPQEAKKDAAYAAWLAAKALQDAAVCKA